MHTSLRSAFRIRRLPSIAIVIIVAGCSGGGGSASSDTPGITRSLTSTTLNLSEGGTAQTYTLALNSAPSAEVTVTFTTGGHVAVTPSTLSFTPGDWSAAKEVTVVAVDDNVADGTHSDTITHRIASGDSRYGVLTLGNITVDITDNDAAGVNIVESAGSTQVTEGGAGDNYGVSLTSQPSSDVTITISSNGFLNVALTTLSFNANNWNLPQSVTVAAINNTTVEGMHSVAITHSASSADADYNGIAIDSVDAQLLDNDTVATLEFLGADAVASEGDGSVTVPVRLRLNAPVLLPNPVSGTITVLGASTARSAIDVAIQSSGVTFPAGSNDGDTQSLVINIIDDALDEPMEKLDLNLSSSSGQGSVLGNNVDYQMHLRDNELPRLIASGATSFGGYSVSRLLGIDTANGAGRRLTGTGLAGFAAITGTAYQATTNTLYAVADGELVKINLNTGVGNVVGITAITAGLAFDPLTGTLYGSDRTNLYTVNTVTAATTTVGAFGGGYTNVEGLAFNASGALYGSDTTANELLSIDKSSGSATQIGAFGVGGLAGMVFGASNTLYATSTTLDQLYTVNTGTGAATAVSAQTLGFGNVAAISYAASTNTLYGFDTTTRQLLIINTASGVGQTHKATGFGDVTGVQLKGLAYDTTRRLFYGVASDALGDQYLLRVYAATGAAGTIAKISNVTGTLYDLAFDADSGRLYGVDGSRLYRIDTLTGAATLLGDTARNLRGLAYDSINAKLYASDPISDRLLTLNTTNASATDVGNMGFGDVEGLEFVGGSLYGIDTDPAGKNPQIVVLNTSNGAGTSLGAVLHEDMSSALAYDSTRAALYGANKLGLLRLDLSNGRGTSSGQLGVEQMLDVAYANGVLYGVVRDSDDGKLVTIDLTTGTTTPVASLGVPCCIDGLAFIGNTLYAVNTSNRNLVTVNITTGAVNNVGVIGSHTQIPGALAYDAVHAKLYGIGGSGTGPFTYELITLNPANGAVTAMVSIVNTGITALAYDPTGDKLYGYDANIDRIITIDPTTGIATEVGDPGYGGILGLTWR